MQWELKKRTAIRRRRPPRKDGARICPLTRGIPRRQIYSVPISLLPALHNQNKWQGLKTVIMVVSERQLWNKTTNEVKFYILHLLVMLNFYLRGFVVIGGLKILFIGV